MEDEKKQKKEEKTEVGISEPEKTETKQGSRGRRNRNRNRNSGTNSTNPFNSIEWYTPVGGKACVEDAGSLSFNRPLGGSFEVYGSKLTVPGIVRIDYLPSYGLANNAVAPMNLAATNIYQFVRHMNSGHANYESVDLMMYLMAMDSIYTGISAVQRVIGLCAYYQTLNRYVPAKLIAALGFADTPASIDGIYQDLPNIRFQFNLLIAKVNSLNIPKLNITLRHVFMNANVYRDRDSEKSQLYCFVPRGLYEYNATQSETGGGLDLIVLDNSLTVRSLIGYINQCLDALLTDEDCGIISGDILKAYKDNCLSKAEMLTSSYSLMPVFVPEILEQIHNSQCIPFVSADAELEWLTTPSIKITQANGKAVFNPVIDPEMIYISKALASSYTPVLNAISEHPSSDDVMIATRLATLIFSDTVQSNYTFTSIGSEIVLGYAMYFMDSTVQFSTFDRSSGKDLYWLNAFAMHPIVYYGTIASTKMTAVTIVYGDLDNYTVYTHDNKLMLDECALFGLFGLPLSSSSNSK